jgi:hypothetical protein
MSRCRKRIGDKFYRGQKNCCDPLEFSPIPIKCIRHGLSVIYFCSSLTSILPVFYSCQRGIDYWRCIYAKKLMQTKTSFYWCRWRSTLDDCDFLSGFFLFFEFLLMLNLRELGEMFGCRFFIQVLRYFYSWGFISSSKPK